MDFNDKPQEAEYRSQVRQWLEQHAQRRTELDADPFLNCTESERLVAAARWQKLKDEAGYAAITWPEEFGGAGGTAVQAVIYQQEEQAFAVPGNVYEMGIGFILPTLISHGSAAQRQRYLKPGLEGDEIWCQLFSEPSAGSDLAALRSKAVRDGDNWVINGQKVWTSYAHFAHFGLLLVRTDASVPKHKGLTMFVVDMESPGIDIRPIQQINGESEFSEVFFTDVRIADENRVGAVGDGWKMALTTLMNERLTVLNSFPMTGSTDILAYASDLQLDGVKASEHPMVRHKVADWYVQEQGLEHFKSRVLTRISQGELPGPEASLGKLLRPLKGQEVGAFAMELAGLAGIVDESGETALADFQATYWMGTILRLGGGTDDIQRNILAERVLGLPPEPRVDKDTAFADLPVGGK